MTPESNGKKWRILCIDDDADVLFVLKTVLGTKHEVVTAVDGLEAVSMLDFCDADFVICDVRMPGLDGFQTVEAIRRHPGYIDIPVFFLTAETDRDMAKRGYASGGNLYLTKPFDPMRLLRNVDYFLEESGHQPRARRLMVDAIASAAGLSRATAPSGTPTAAAPAPASPAASSPASPAREIKRAATGKPRVIVISTNAAQLERVRQALEEKCECIVGADPLASLQKLFRYEPDILIINPAIPHLSGWGLVQMISSNPRLKGLTIILLEDDYHPIDSRLVLAISKHPLLPATFSGEDIEAVIESALNTPGFAIRVKKESFVSLLQEEDELRSQMKEKRDLQEHQDQARMQRYKRIQSFIDSEMQ